MFCFICLRYAPFSEADEAATKNIQPVHVCTGCFLGFFVFALHNTLVEQHIRDCAKENLNIK